MIYLYSVTPDSAPALPVGIELQALPTEEPERAMEEKDSGDIFAIGFIECERDVAGFALARDTIETYRDGSGVGCDGSGCGRGCREFCKFNIGSGSESAEHVDSMKEICN